MTLARSLPLFMDDGGTPLPVVHNALTKTQAESLRRRECNRLVLRPEYSNFPASSLSERRRGMQLR